MGIGYASINSITGEIQGTVIANVQDGVFITNIELNNNVDANLSTSKIHKYVGTMMQSTIELSGSNPNSEITYKVTVYNNLDESCMFLDILYDESKTDFYDNSNIIFEIKENGFRVGDVINAHETKDIYITFKYKDGTIPENTVLNSYLNFKIAEPNRLVVASQGDSSSKYLGSTITKNKIETIKFELGETEPVGTKSSFDASEKQDKSIIGYYTDVDNNGLYELTFLSNELIATNKNAQFLFQEMRNLKSIKFENFSTWGTTNMKYTFFGCQELTTLDISKFDTSDVTDMRNMFYDCHKLESLDLSGFDTRNVTNMHGMFHACSNLESLDLSGFKTSNVTEMNDMFYYCSKLTKLNLSGFNTGKVTDMKSMFYYCSELTTLDLSKFNTSNVTDMSYMFYNCYGLTTLDVSKFNTSKVTNMERMFTHCAGLTTIDISGFNTNIVTNMSKIFGNCNKLTTVYVSEYNSGTSKGWTTSNVTSSADMFTSCNNIKGGNGTTYNSSYIDKTYARIDTAETPGYFTNILDKT